MKINKVYTKTGDGGDTGLVGGERVPKDSLRIEAYGTIDELQAVLGLFRAELRLLVEETGINSSFAAEMLNEIHSVQNDLFDIGSELATPASKKDHVRNPLDPKRIRFLERRMDELTPDLVPLNSFVLSGGGKYSALIHLARTVCRRAERCAIRFSREEPVRAECIGYLNRLSDYLFVLARHLAKRFGENEPLWETPLR